VRRAGRFALISGARAASPALAAVLTGIRRFDLPAAGCRVDLFAAHGFTLWTAFG